MTSEAVEDGNYQPDDSAGWCYNTLGPDDGKDCRCLVSLQQEGMEWVGLRAWNHAHRRWYNGGEPELARVIAWQPIPTTARRHWSRGILQPEPAGKSAQWPEFPPTAAAWPLREKP